MIIDNFKGSFGWVITKASYVQKEADLKIVFVWGGFEMEFLMDPMWNKFLCQDKNREVDLKVKILKIPIT